jgi:uncharacterized protein YqjF (DUF2071 family)
MPEVFLSAHWQKLIMVNYKVTPDLLSPYLPAHVELDDFEGTHLVSLVGFLFKDTKIFGLPVPLFGTFEEVNLRFYVKRKVGNSWQRGVVFINESVPYKAVAWLANVLYKEHYTALKTSHKWEIGDQLQHIQYSWFKQRLPMWLMVEADITPKAIKAGSCEEFIFEHYYGYTKVTANETLEYRVDHPRWQTYAVRSCKVHCNFDKMYGQSFAVLNEEMPHSVFMAQGSPITVGWKRQRIK